MEEELEVTGATRLTPVGLINDDTNAVGAVHVGLVQILELLDGDARVREIDQLEGSFVTLAELRERAERRPPGDVVEPSGSPAGSRSRARGARPARRAQAAGDPSVVKPVPRPEGARPQLT